MQHKHKKQIAFLLEKKSATENSFRVCGSASTSCRRVKLQPLLFLCYFRCDGTQSSKQLRYGQRHKNFLVSFDSVQQWDQDYYFWRQTVLAVKSRAECSVRLCHLRSYKLQMANLFNHVLMAQQIHLWNYHWLFSKRFLNSDVSYHWQRNFTGYFPGFHLLPFCSLFSFEKRRCVKDEWHINECKMTSQWTG